MRIQPFFSGKTFISKTLAGETAEKPIIENKNAAVLLNIDPCRDGHALIVTKAPHQYLRELSKEELSDVWQLVTDYQRLWENLPENKSNKYQYSMFINDGKQAGQSVPHFHVQIVPVKIENPIPPGALRHAINPNPLGVPKEKSEFLAQIQKIYKPFNNNVDTVHKFAKKTGNRSTFSKVG